MNFLDPTQNPMLGPLLKIKFMCLIFWERMQEVTHINFFRGICRSEKGVTTGLFLPTKVLRNLREWAVFRSPEPVRLVKMYCSTPLICMAVRIRLLFVALHVPLRLEERETPQYVSYFNNLYPLYCSMPPTAVRLQFVRRCF